MKCVSCGKKNLKDEKYCTTCGLAVKQDAEQAEVLKIIDKQEFKNSYKPSRGRVIVGAVAIFLFVVLIISSNNSGNPTKETGSSQIAPQIAAPYPSTQPSTSVNYQLFAANAKDVVVNILCDNDEGGSGVVIDKEGWILTNYHVISGATACVVTFPDKNTGQPAEIYIGTPESASLSKEYDIAGVMITSAYIDDEGYQWGSYPRTFVEYNPPGNCDGPTLGDSVRIYGYPVTSGGYNLTITDGIISSFSDDGFILTSAKVDTGNSGGLAEDGKGCYLGIPSAVAQGTYQNLGIIIPLSVISEFADQITD